MSITTGVSNQLCTVYVCDGKTPSVSNAADDQLPQTSNIPSNKKVSVLLLSTLQVNATNQSAKEAMTDQKQPHTHVCADWASGFQRKTRTHAQSKAEVMLTHKTPTQLCHNPEIPTRDSCCLLSDFTPVLLLPVFPEQPKTTNLLKFCSLILTPVGFFFHRPD